MRKGELPPELRKALEKEGVDTSGMYRIEATDEEEQAADRRRMLENAKNQEVTGSTFEEIVKQLGLTEEDFKGKSWLDIGAGKSNFVEGALKAGAKTAIAYDFNINQSEVNAPKVTGLAEELAVPDNSFDRILCFRSLPNVYDMDKVLREAHRALKPGGKAYFSDLAATSILPGSVRFGRQEVWVDRKKPQEVSEGFKSQLQQEFGDQIAFDNEHDSFVLTKQRDSNETS